MIRHFAAGLVMVVVVGPFLAGCAARDAAVTRYGPTAFTYPPGASADGWAASDFASAFESDGFRAQSESARVGGASSTWGASTFGINGKTVVVRDYAAAGQPRLRVVSVDGAYDTPLGRAITDWMIQRSGLRERVASHRRPARMPAPAARLYAPALYAFDADPRRVADAVRATAAAEGWTASADRHVEHDGIAIGRHAFTDAAGTALTVETFAPRFQPTLVQVSCAAPDPNVALAVFNGVKSRLDLPIGTPAPSASAALAGTD